MMIKANITQAVILRLNHLPHMPRSPRFHATHLSWRDSYLRSRLAFLVIFRISSFPHSGPRAGTVTISTGPAELALSSMILGVVALDMGVVETGR